MCIRTYLIWLLAGLWLVPALSHAQPAWYKKPEKDYPQTRDSANQSLGLKNLEASVILIE